MDAQVDFGEARVIMKGRPLTVQLFVGRLCFSKIPFLVASPNQQQEALFEGHEKSFDFFGGVPRTIWYDRLSQAVRRALPGHKPQEQEAFTAFRSHYLFESRFCNPREAHEKGLVENLVGYARLSEIPSLLCTRRMAWRLFDGLRSFPPMPLSKWHYPGRCRLPASSGEYSLSPDS